MLEVVYLWMNRHAFKRGIKELDRLGGGHRAHPGGTTFFTENLGGTAGPGGTSFSTENLDSRLINHDDVFLPQPGCTITAAATVGVMGSSVPVENFCTGYCFDGNTSQQENIFAPSNMQIMNDSLF